MTDSDGLLMVSWWKQGRPDGEGAKWSVDHTTAVVRGDTPTHILPLTYDAQSALAAMLPPERVWRLCVPTIFPLL